MQLSTVVVQKVNLFWCYLQANSFHQLFLLFPLTLYHDGAFKNVRKREDMKKVKFAKLA